MASATEAPGGVPNEHPWLTEVALAGTLDGLSGGSASQYILDALGPAQRELGDRPYVIDLNPFACPSRYRIDAGAFPERRALPDVAAFSGLPDYSYSLYDWINMGAECPIRGASKDGCHDFKRWLGAGLNASHFGRRAASTYVHLHRVALRLGSRASALRSVTRADGRKLADLYPDVVVEAEIEALYFEAIAQHFLQDRWASGHMWERWGGHDVSDGSALESRAFLGLLAGLVHGIQAVTGRPTLMSAPIVARDRVIHAKWASGAAGDAFGHPAVGDFELGTLLGQRLSRDGYEGDFDGRRQKDVLLGCSQTGWTEVVRAFGANPDGSHGALGLRLRMDAGGMDPVTCTSAFATNRSLHDAWSGVADGEASIVDLTFAKLAMATIPGLASYLSVGESPEGVLHANATRKELLLFLAKLRLLAATKPNGTDVSDLRDGLGELRMLYPRSERASGFAAPDYLEPVPELEGLRLVGWEGGESGEDAGLPRCSHGFDGGSVPGRDLATLYGFFNRSHADYWCRASEVLESLRGKRGVERRVCTYLATRLFREAGRREGSLRAEIRGGVSLCEFFGESHRSPAVLPAGYVGTPGRYDSDGVLETVGNWCDRIPILDSVRDDVVGVMPSGAGVLWLAGEDLGGAKASLRLTRIADGSQREVAGVPFGARALLVQVDAATAADAPYFVDVMVDDVGSGRVSDQRRSVGRFLIRAFGEEVGKGGSEGRRDNAPGASVPPPPTTSSTFGGVDATTTLSSEGVAPPPSTSTSTVAEGSTTTTTVADSAVDHGKDTTLDGHPYPADAHPVVSEPSAIIAAIERFQFGRATVPAEGLVAVRTAAKELATKSVDDTVTVAVVGYCDTIGDEWANVQLGCRRANRVAVAIREALKNESPSPLRRVSIVEDSVGRSEAKWEATDARREKDRRVEMRRTRRAIEVCRPGGPLPCRCERSN